MLDYNINTKLSNTKEYKFSNSLVFAFPYTFNCTLDGTIMNLLDSTQTTIDDGKR